MVKKLVLLVMVIYTAVLFAQDYKADNRDNASKEYMFNSENIGSINNIDVLQAFRMIGININKFHLGKFDKEYKINIIIEEFQSGNISNTDTLFSDTNKYFWIQSCEDTTSYYDYIDHLEIITKDEEDISKIKINTIHDTFRSNYFYKIDLTKKREKQFYIWRCYSKTHWILNKKVPLIVCASSWKDKYGTERFCGAGDLSFDKESTQELLSSSPHYYLISYIVTE